MALMGVDEPVVEGEQTSAEVTEGRTEASEPDAGAENISPAEVKQESAVKLSVVQSETNGNQEVTGAAAPETASTTSGDETRSSNSLPAVDATKSALVSKVLKKAREAAAGASLGELDQRSTGSTPTDQKSTGATRFEQKNTGTTRLPDQRSTGSVSRLPDQRNTGVNRSTDQGTTGSVSRFPDQRNTGATRFPDQRSTGATRFDGSTTGSTRFNDQRSTGATPSYVDQTTTGTIKALIGRPSESGEDQTDENAPVNAKKSLAATIETEAKKSNVAMGKIEKIVTKHPILVGTAAFCIFVLPIYGLIMNAQSPSERAEYKASWGKDVKLIASKLGKTGEYKGHKVGFYINRADAYIKSAEYQSAISDLKIARQLDVAKADDCNIKLSQCYIKLKDFKNASAAAAEVLKSDPTNVDALLQHGRASYMFGNKLTALDDYFKAVKLDPANPAVFIERGDYYVAEKKPGSAAADYKHALELAPSLVEAQKKLAACTVVAPRSSASAAADEADAASKLSPAARKLIAESDFDTLRSKGYQALQKGDHNFAIAALSRAVALNPNGALVRQYLAHALIAAGEYPDAVAQFNAWDKIATLKLSEKLAFARRLPENNQSAAALYDQLVQQHSADGQALIAIAQAAASHGYGAQVQSAVEAGQKVGTPAEKAQLATMKVSAEKQAAADITSGKVKLEN